VPDELVDLYSPDDDTGRVVGTVPRSRMRADNLPHAATAVLLVDDAGRIYVHRRTDDKDVFAGMWDCWAGGVVTAGEDPEQAAVRELAEELGVSLPRLEPLFRHWYRDDRTWYLAWCYRARWNGRQIVHQPDEVAEGGWFTLAELRTLLDDPARPFVPDGRVGIERYLAERLDAHPPAADPPLSRRIAATAHRGARAAAAITRRRTS
jgi:8-oxo-dGTP pyrophosphatase MutT (NUDIX family)